MPTDNPKISAYVPQAVYDRFEEFYKSAGLSMSQAATLIFAERFGFEEIVRRITKENTVDVSVLDEIKELKSRLEMAERKIEDLQGINKLESNKSFVEQKIDELESDLESRPPNEDELIIDDKLTDENTLNGNPISELLSKLPVESAEVTQPSLELRGLQGELLEEKTVFDGITASALATRLISKRTGKPLSVSSVSQQDKFNLQKFAEWTSKLDRDKVSWKYNEKTGLFTPFGDLSDEVKTKVSEFIKNNLPRSR